MKVNKKKKRRSSEIFKFNRHDGITLIALVVTIIVLLILAGVSISMLTGENGILKRANEAKEETVRATDEEQRKMAMYEAAMNTERTYFQGVPIPAGFAPTRIAGESTVEEGLVITDSQGNEFVWITCVAEKSEDGSEDEIYYNNGKNDDNRENNWRDGQNNYNGGIWYDAQPHITGKPSIQKEGNGGFYVARYEAGVPENASFYVSEKSTGEELIYKGKEEKNYTAEEPKTIEDNKQDIRNLVPVSKKGNQAWNCISQTNAKIVAGNVVDNSDVKSYLIDSHAWNTICRLIEKKYNGTNQVTNSINWGNYINNTTTKYEKLKGLWADFDNGEGGFKQAEKYKNEAIPKKTRNRQVELATGICEDFKVYNIYDLAGNMWEWTTETGKKSDNNDTTCNENDCTINPETNAPNAVLRGGSFDNDGSNAPVVLANGSMLVGDTGCSIGFRVVLYLK